MPAKPYTLNPKQEMLEFLPGLMTAYCAARGQAQSVAVNRGVYRGFIGILHGLYRDYV